MMAKVSFKIFLAGAINSYLAASGNFLFLVDLKHK